jgi:hypothetical protein
VVIKLKYIANVPISIKFLEFIFLSNNNIVNINNIEAVNNKISGSDNDKFIN